MKRVALFGSTGSIGRQALDVIDKSRQQLSVAVLACGKNIDLIRAQLGRYHPEMAVVMDEEDAKVLRKEFQGIEILSGKDGYKEAARADYDVMLNAMMGISGLEPTYEAVKLGKEIALANKETLVAGGSVIMREAKKTGTVIKPVDSEHSAIYQCLEGRKRDTLKRILLTGSGGPFREFTAEQMKTVTKEMALRHPRWTMGPKITIDSSTLMNKGLEVIEAKWLFDVEVDDITVVIHPESIIHSMVEFRDGAVLAQMGVPDMEIPIAYALTMPDRLEGVSESIDFFGSASTLHFERPDTKRFPCLALATEALRRGGTYTAVMNGANEALVAAFLDGRIGYTDIPVMIERVLEEHSPERDPGIEEILEADRTARKMIERYLGENT